jgi:hypothetical protein
MPDHGVHPSVAENHIPYQDAFGDYVQEAADGEKRKTDHDAGDAITVDCRGGKATQDNKVSKVTPGKQMFFGPHGSAFLNGLAPARCYRGVSKIHLFR